VDQADASDHWTWRIQSDHIDAGCVKHTIEKTGKLVVKAWTQVKDVVDAGILATHKFKGSGEVVQDVIERCEAGRVVLDLTGEAAQRNRERMLAAIAGWVIRG
jgi:hypothetical protein